jgi:hypothetical protein
MSSLNKPFYATIPIWHVERGHAHDKHIGAYGEDVENAIGTHDELYYKYGLGSTKRRNERFKMGDCTCVLVLMVPSKGWKKNLHEFGW